MALTPSDADTLRADLRAWLVDNAPGDPGFLLPQDSLAVESDQQFHFLRDWQQRPNQEEEKRTAQIEPIGPEKLHPPSRTPLLTESPWTQDKQTQTPRKFGVEEQKVVGNLLQPLPHCWKLALPLAALVAVVPQNRRFAVRAFTHHGTSGRVGSDT